MLVTTEPGLETDEPCDVLHEEVPYVQGWMGANEALTALRKALEACGLKGCLPYARADVTVAGVGVVELGRITPETAGRLAALLARAYRADDDADGESRAA
ncbi:hypothetical protein SAMN05443668_10463 [Cryptosporangium aurantiacum]|uniref:Uncharacterized protein n=2 Tax=Cryptosporangium aurantiacum TaxID=134849 RepID=A0A1M7Q2Y4_9ACTN|nr:hypothetical protein SAMN05443668_10463 [Cryptosporangium aurantiacum]